MTTPLARKLARLIQLNGPIGVADYFATCLGDPEFGYYRTRDPFGRSGDFTTAPEISQLFGEMIGIFMIHAWKAHGSPRSVTLVEIGPGRGTLMADATRTIVALAPDLAAASRLALVETSPALRTVQHKTLGTCPIPVGWHDRFEDVESAFTLLVANELFDALPIRQFICTPAGFRERVVTVGSNGALVFAAGAAGLDPAFLPHAEPRSGDVFEIAPARTALATLIAARLRANGGTALLIDYGHARSDYGDTLQAVRNHCYEPVLERPGEADLTSHVDFEKLAEAAGSAHVMPLISQGDFLLGLGLVERAGRLGSDKNAETRNEIAAAVHRLAGTGENEMGNLFKVLCINGAEVAIPPFFADN
jgi:SAM-dependent MidA family methyltransferase